MKFLRNGKLCEISNPNVSIARWWILRTAGPDDDEMGYTQEVVSDKRTEELLDYFDKVEVGT